jgi:hypothetical protein
MGSGRVGRLGAKVKCQCGCHSGVKGHFHCFTGGCCGQEGIDDPEVAGHWNDLLNKLKEEAKAKKEQEQQCKCPCHKGTVGFWHCFTDCCAKPNEIFKDG